MDALKKILIIDDEKNMCHMLSVLLKKAGYMTETACDGQDGLDKVQYALNEKDPYDFILCDIKMPNIDGMEFLKAVKEKSMDATNIIMMTAYGSIDMAVEAIKLGAYDFISKPFKSDEILFTLKRAQERELLKKENQELKKRIQAIKKQYSFGNMIASSKSMLEIFELGTKVAQYTTTVLITGESGTGKELVAKAIHFASPRADKPFIPVNCGGIPDTLIESELFGYKKGAFTGAQKDKKGLFEEADQGTIFLDEIGELSLTLQVRLLRVLQENEIRAVGDSLAKKIDVRVLAATSKDLEQEINEGRFRHDLFYRLNVLTLKLPPLRDRVDDIPLLSLYFIDQFNKSFKKSIQEISPDAFSILIKHKWPGNVRELENVIERAVVLCDGNIITTKHLPSNMHYDLNNIDKASNILESYFNGFSLKEAQQVLEKKLIEKALKDTGGNRTKAVQMLGISHPSLVSKIKTYNINL